MRREGKEMWLMFAIAVGNVACLEGIASSAHLKEPAPLFLTVVLGLGDMCVRIIWE